jgi:plasmid stabilization system protein ParE
MASLRYSDQAIADLERIARFLETEEPSRAQVAVALIAEALGLLEQHPLIGRITVDPLRELIISQGRSGYIALYSYDAKRNRILVKAIRHQRESGFDEP